MNAEDKNKEEQQAASAAEDECLRTETTEPSQDNVVTPRRTEEMCLEERDSRVLEEDLAELTTRVTRLEESNRALEEALLEGPDEDYSLALTENKAVLERTRETIARIEKALKEAKELESQMAALKQTNSSSCDSK